MSQPTESSSSAGLPLAAALEQPKANIGRPSERETAQRPFLILRAPLKNNPHPPSLPLVDSVPLDISRMRQRRQRNLNLAFLLSPICLILLAGFPVLHLRQRQRLSCCSSSSSLLLLRHQGPSTTGGTVQLSYQALPQEGLIERGGYEPLGINAVSLETPECDGLYIHQPIDSHLRNSWGPAGMRRGGRHWGETEDSHLRNSWGPAGMRRGGRHWGETDARGSGQVYAEVSGEVQLNCRCGDAAAAPHLLPEANGWTAEGPVDPDQEAAAFQPPFLLPQQQRRGELKWTNGHMPEAMPSLARGLNGGVAAPDALSLLSRLQEEVHQLKLQQQLQQEEQKRWQRQQQLQQQQPETTAWFQGESPHHRHQATARLRSTTAAQPQERRGFIRGKCMCNCVE
ncbi:hypothetical protein, conserved [Eimeria praecox]|uniref:Uncharacterized protein n=1 Tax=Eimeria praecox TaxID=51316 RepID=U6GU67_9EIME|nr:hypothetical protein, conserved [Eimeria praecox]